MKLSYGFFLVLLVVGFVSIVVLGWVPINSDIVLPVGLFAFIVVVLYKYREPLFKVRNALKNLTIEDHVALRREGERYFKEYLGETVVRQGGTNLLTGTRWVGDWYLIEFSERTSGKPRIFAKNRVDGRIMHFIGKNLKDIMFGTHELQLMRTKSEVSRDEAGSKDGKPIPVTETLDFTDYEEWMENFEED